MTYILIMASSSDTSRADWKLPPNYPLILPFGAIIGHPLLTIIQTDSQTTRSKPAMVACVYFRFLLDIVISIENYIPKQNKYSHKVNKRVDQPILQNLMYIFDVDPILYSIKLFVNILFLCVLFLTVPL